MHELLNQCWNRDSLKNQAPHVVSILNRLNQVSYWVPSIILMHENLRDRGSAVSFFIDVATVCLPFLFLLSILLSIPFLFLLSFLLSIPFFFPLLSPFLYLSIVLISSFYPFLLSIPFLSLSIVLLSSFYPFLPIPFLSPSYPLPSYRPPIKAQEVKY